MNSKVVAMLYRKEPDGRGGFRMIPLTTLQWLTTPQVAAVCDVSVQTIHRDRDEGWLEGHLFRGTYRYMAEDVQTYIEQAKNREREESNKGRNGASEAKGVSSAVKERESRLAAFRRGSPRALDDEDQMEMEF